jgi:hypothetical protein
MLPGRFVARSGSKLGAPAFHTQSRSNVACHSVENSRRKRKSNAGGFCHLPRPSSPRDSESSASEAIVQSIEVPFTRLLPDGESGSRKMASRTPRYPAVQLEARIAIIPEHRLRSASGWRTSNRYRIPTHPRVGRFTGHVTDRRCDAG